MLRLYTLSTKMKNVYGKYLGTKYQLLLKKIVHFSAKKNMRDHFKKIDEMHQKRLEMSKKKLFWNPKSKF